MKNQRINEKNESNMTIRLEEISKSEVKRLSDNKLSHESFKSEQYETKLKKIRNVEEDDNKKM